MTIWLWKTSQPPEWLQSTFSALLWEQLSIHVLLTSGDQTSYSPPGSPTSPPSSQGGLSSLCRTPGLECLICGSNHSLPREGFCPCNSLFPLSFPPRGQVPTWLLLFLSYPILCAPFLQPWLYRGLSANLHLVLSENCVTCRCIFWCVLGRRRVLHPPSLLSWLKSLNWVFRLRNQWVPQRRSDTFYRIEEGICRSQDWNGEKKNMKKSENVESTKMIDIKNNCKICFRWS